MRALWRLVVRFLEAGTLAEWLCLAAFLVLIALYVWWPR